MEIRILKENETVRYAAEELKKYLKLVDESVDSEITLAPVKSNAGITLALLSELGLSDHDVDDPLIDDVVDVDVVNLSGYIAGSNARSILMGEPYKVPLSELQNKVAVRAKADELGVSFPNWL